ncbi:MAG TPA: membrane protein insertase YidC [Rhabdochlamydiaceae bacterium]|nr:membrane protein insertase YidC [Rhabdochlamydiaceae bacterium]
MNKRTLIFAIALGLCFYLTNWYFAPPPAVPATTQTAKPQQEAQAPVRPYSAPNAVKGESQKPAEKQEFYVIENDYQQLVFSNLGGSLEEINLPFQSPQNPKSVVKEIDIDRQMRKSDPQNDLFPLFPYKTLDETGKMVEKEGTVGGYYPLIRRSQLGSGGNIASKVSPNFYALNVFSEQEGPESHFYKLTRFEKNLIEFQLDEPQRRITKTFTLPEKADDAPYSIDLTVKVDGDTRGLVLTPGVPEVELISDNFSPTLKYKLTKQNKAQIEQIDLPKTSTSFSYIYPNWISDGNGFFGMIVDPLIGAGPGFTAANIPGDVVPSRIALVDAQYKRYPADKYPGYTLQIPLSPTATGGVSKFRIFAGPLERNILNKVDTFYTDPTTGKNPDYRASISFQGWFSFISEPFAKFLFFLMKFFHSLTFSWGFSIILLTIALRIMLYPLNNWSIKSTLKMQEIGPKIAAIQEKYKKDPKRAQIEVVTLYREKGVNPFSGCFPLLIQMPFLIGMFDLLKSTFELRGVSFIPGWIDNLTAPDVLFSWNYPIIFFGTEFHLLPVILGFTMYFQQKMTANKSSQATLTDQQKQQKMMGNIMTIVFTVLFYHFPSGLNIYWLFSMLLGILQQWWTTRKIRSQAPVDRNTITVK